MEDKQRAGAKRIDFVAVNACALDQLEAVCRRWLPNGKRAGSEWQTGDRSGAVGQSLRAHLSGDKAGVWSDFATGDSGGDPVSLVAYVDGVSQGEAARRLAEFLGIPTANPAPISNTLKNKDKRKSCHSSNSPLRPENKAPTTQDAPTWRPILPIPDDAPPRPEAHPRHGKPDIWHTYRDAAGRVLGYVARFEKSSKRQKKEFAWLVYAEHGGRKEWRWQGFDVPRPLYGLDLLAARPDVPVLLVEGEKACDAARGLMPAWIAMTWPGGSKAVDKADFGPLAGCDVILWPDNDATGLEAMDKAARLLTEAGAASVRLLNIDLFAKLAPGADEAGAPILIDQTRELPKGWDVADALAEGWTADHFALLAGRPDFYAAAPIKHEKPDTATAEPAAGKDSPFIVTKDGLYSVATDRDGELRRRRIADYVRPLSLGRDPSGAVSMVVIEFIDLDKKRRTIILPRRLFVADGLDGVRALVDAGLRIESGRNIADLLKQYINDACPTARATVSDRLGWHGERFLYPDGAVGNDEAEHVIYQGSKTASADFSTRANLADWRREIAALAVGNSRLLFALSLGFAGFLLKSCGGPNFGVHFVGGSSVGKTGALVAAGSVHGPREFVLTWRATDNSVEYLAAARCDTLLIFDEIKEGDARQTGAIIYMLGNGRGKSRAHHAGGLRDAVTWRVVLVSSGEIGVADQVASAGQKLHAGQDVRLIEISADAGAGHGMWENLHGLSDGAQFTNTLKANAARYHGTAGRAFIASLIERLPEVPGQVKAIEDRFFGEFVPADAGGQVRRVASCFALTAAAGELAGEWHIVPWERDAAFEAAGQLFGEWLQGRPTVGDLEQSQILAHVRRLMERGWQSRFVDWARVSEESADLSRMAAIQEPLGFRKKDVPFAHESPNFLFYVTRERFHEEFCTKAGFKPRAVACLLRARGILKCDANSTTWRETLPNGDSRSYCIIARRLWEESP